MIFEICVRGCVFLGQRFLVALLSLSLFTTSAWTQSADLPKRTLQEVLLGFVSQAVPVQSIPGNQIVLSRSFRALADAGVFPNLIDGNKDFENRISISEKIPAKDPLADPSKAAALVDTLSKLRDDVQFGNKALDSSDAAVLAAAKLLLYANTQDTPTEAYKSYLSYSDQYKTQVTQLQQETNPATRVSIQNRISQLERDWELFGMRNEIEAALQQISDLEPASSAPLFNEWLTLLNKTDPSENIATIRDALSNSDWIRVSASSGDLGALKLTLKLDGGSFDLPQISRVSFDVTVGIMPHAFLNHPFLTNTRWRTRSGLVLSDGNVVTDDPSEILPRVASGFVIVKNLDITLSSAADRSALVSLGRSRAASLSSLTIKSKGSPEPAYQLRSISVSGPILLAITIDELAKLPNPAVGLNWEE
ncbi:hypothetical protein NKJ86_13800 [Mesorhizobium sp. M0025]|uniref:hypothetical protein n=1 Tax=Mesorhizobium sp. M0025 TaxID=2956846 RepID=UPI00333B1122